MAVGIIFMQGKLPTSFHSRYTARLSAKVGSVDGRNGHTWMHM